MAINNVNSSVNNTQLNTKFEQQSRPAEAQTTQSAPRQDAVSLTPQAQQLAQLQRRAENNSGVDEAKVERIKQALANGDYSIDAERLAANIASFEADMFGNGE
ncbi:flagellar biosynthesis anti-sigma factor FlgM [Aliidiomarina sedimenti]|uniref:Negative regulator of flagellin synthesis n=2 Tax=Aliidiomarina TaxID=1249554 RepID=A0A432WCT6_9GAMM|nr:MULTISPECIES: flagellar biosynthesis anti-sigma factor FlgM [Aliidiomarina]RUO29877.1 flagellar biosynthesis anti-sigma factor FlgM [Aliidiomarina sedimenti]RUO30216.1 flagellar biosynthesis anti-sigma factor FlgM [Aliidiomarina soli]